MNKVGVCVDDSTVIRVQIADKASAITVEEATVLIALLRAACDVLDVRGYKADGKGEDAR